MRREEGGSEIMAGEGKEGRKQGAPQCLLRICPYPGDVSRGK